MRSRGHYETIREICAFVILPAMLVLSACGNTPPVATVNPSPISTATFTSTPPATETATPTPSLTPEPATSTPTAAEVTQFPMCEVEKWRECPVAVDDLFSAEDGGTGKYLAWLKTLSKPFDPAKLKFLSMEEIGLGIIVYDTSHVPNYKDPATRPFRRNVTSAITTFGGVDYLVLPVEYADKDDPGNVARNTWTIAITPMNFVGDRLGDPLPPGIEKKILNTWVHKMNIAPLMKSTSFPAGEVPLAKKSWKAVGEAKMLELFGRFEAGETKALDGKVVLVWDSVFENHWLE